MTAPVFKPGTVFLHGRFIEEDRTPAVCRVTAVRRGVVYFGFGADARKARYHATPEYLLRHGATLPPKGTPNA